MFTPAHFLKTARRQMRKIRHRGAKTDTEKRLLASADQQRLQNLGWRFDGFSDWSITQLLESLAKMGIVTNEDLFREEAQKNRSPTKVAEYWATYSQAEGKWKDFPNLAARELWQRLLPDQKVPETVADEIDALLEAAEVSSSRAEHWLQAARRLVEQCTSQGKGDSEFFESVQRESGCDLRGWMAEVPDALLGSPWENEAAELCLAFSWLAEEKAMLALRAEILAKLGRQQESISLIEQLLAEYPSDLLVLYKGSMIFQILGENDRAHHYLEEYEKAIQAPEAASNMAAAAKTGVILPRFFNQPPGQSKPAHKAGERANSSNHLNPNDRCSCGSGKKYKRCCGG